MLVSKQRRRRGLPPLPIIGQLFDALLDAEDQITGNNGTAATSTKTSGAENKSEEIPRPVAVLKNDIGDFMAYPEESSTATAVLQPHPILKARTFGGESVMFPPPPEQPEDKRLPGAGMTSTYLMPKQIPESPVSPLSSTSPQSVAFPVFEQQLQQQQSQKPMMNEEVINVPAPTPIPPADNTPSTEPDSKDSKDSQDPQKKKKKNKKKKKSKSKNKDSKDKKRWSKHKHHDKKKKEATIVDSNGNIPPIL
uniref:Uncharacterized protein n=1 Tax=Panagrolaimus sp. ES5 TaxID=591445 RepID=A0AC34F1Y9_9BILA